MFILAVPLAVALSQNDPQVDYSCTARSVCTPDYTETVRPSEAWTNERKRQLMLLENAPGAMSDYELDHFMPLELCGAPRAYENLWIEPIKEARIKDKDETSLHRKLCKGEIDLLDAQAWIRAKWKIYDVTPPARP